MSEEFEGGYQTTTEPVTQEPSIQQEPTQVEPSSPQESQYFEIKYNKEPVKVSYDEAPTYIQKGMNYDKVHQQLSEYESLLQDVNQIVGYQSTDELKSYIQQLKQEQQEQQQQELYQEASQGNTEALEQIISNHPDIQYAREMKQQQEETQKFQSEANELFAEFPDLKPEQIPQETWQLKESKGLSLLDAYLRTTYKSMGQQKEQEAIQKLQGNAQSSPGPLGGGDVNHNTNISSLSSKDFGSIVDQVLRGERKTL